MGGDVLSSHLTPLPLPPTTHTYCTSWGRVMWRENREGGVGERKREEKQIKSHKLIEMSMLKCEKRREQREDMNNTNKGVEEDMK